MKRIHCRVALTGLAALSSLAIAQTAMGPAKTAAEATAAIDARKQMFKDLKQTFEPLTAMLKHQRELDAELMAKNAALIEQHARKIPAAFNVDTRQFKDIKTDALEGIWSNQADFKSKAEALARAAANAATVAQSGDKGGMLKSVAEIGKTCGGCHDSYKAKS